ncbi:MAG: amino acid-binding protein [Desulfobacteraceae bacterium]
MDPKRIRQVSVFLENRSGRMAKITTALGQEGVDIRALALADASDFGILRLVLTDTEKGVSILKGKGFTVRVTDVIAVKVDDHPGGLGALLTILENAGLNLEYVYMLNHQTPDQAVFIFRFDNPDKALDVLTSNGLSVLGEDFVLGKTSN